MINKKFDIQAKIKLIKHARISWEVFKVEQMNAHLSLNIICNTFLCAFLL